jgi:hypothetical protein
VVLDVAVWAGTLWLLMLLWPATARRGWTWLWAGAAVAALVSVARPALAQEGGALLASVVFTTLAAWYAARVWDRVDPGAGPPLRRVAVWRQALATTLGTALIAGVGAYLLSALLSSTSYLEEWQYFRGVKVTYAAPPLLTVFVFLAAVGITGLRRRGEIAPLGRELRALGRWVIRGENLAALGLLLAGAAYYILRSGNVSVASVSPIEESARTFLARVLVDRPREKEFLIGYPSMFLAVWLASRRRAGWFWIFLLAASTGLVSMVNSFEHIRTPLADSTLSVIYGLVLGAAIGSVLLWIADSVAEAVHWDRLPEAPVPGEADGDPG